MKRIRALSTLVAILGVLAGAHVATAHEDHANAKASSPAGQLVAVTAKDAAWVKKQKAGQPMTMCVVSDEKLGGSMGDPVDYIYRVAGKPDRLVTLCCKDCVKDFNKDPEKYLKLLDGAAAKKHDADHAKHDH